jgi:DNA-binding CsgD family transcriptional regulator
VAAATAERAVRVLEPAGDSRQHAYALAYLAGLQTNVDRDEEAAAAAAAALAMARRVDAPDLVALGRIAHGNARHKRGDPGAADELCAGIDAAAALSAHVFVMTGHLVLVENLWQRGLLAETERRVAEATAYAEEREVDIYLDSIRAHGFRLQAARGEWEAAEAGLRGLLVTAATGGARYSLPELARLLVRRGADDAAAVVDRAVDHTVRADARYQFTPALMARIELAWLTGRPADARGAAELLAARTATPGAERARADLLRWLRRLGEPAEPFPGCPPEYAAGLRGDWRAAARGFAERGAPYEQALELADSGELEPTLEALRMLEELGARPAAALLRRRLRRRGVIRVPRGPKPTTRANPAGLTDRQVEILRLVVAGRTNAEIAAKLVLSVRTVDHHVSAVLQKLGVTSRREVPDATVRHGLR